MEADPLWSSAEKRRLLLAGGQTAASALLRRRSEAARLPEFSVFVGVSDCVCLTDVVSWPEVERLLHQSVFESVPLTRLDPKGVLVKACPLGTLEPAQRHTPTVIPWDNPLMFAKQQLNNPQATGWSP